MLKYNWSNSPLFHSHPLPQKKKKKNPYISTGSTDHKEITSKLDNKVLHIEIQEDQTSFSAFNMNVK